MPILHKCSWRGCSKIVEEGATYCTYHQVKWDKEQKKRYKEYKDRRLKDEEQKKYQDFYNDKNWKRIRDTVIDNYCGIDILEYYRTGKIVQGEAVHHIVEISEDWNSRFDMCNLIYLTEKNHRRVHAEYDKGVKEKKAMQGILFELVRTWKEQFG